MRKQSTEISRSFADTMHEIEEWLQDWLGVTIEVKRRPKFVYRPKAGWFIMSSNGVTSGHMAMTAAEVIAYYREIGARYRAKRERLMNLPREPELSTPDSDRDLMKSPSQARPTNPTPEEDK